MKERDEKPPFLGSWNLVYVAVAVYAAALILAFYTFGEAFTS